MLNENSGENQKENGGSPSVALIWLAVFVCVLAWGITLICQNSRAADSAYQTPVFNSGK